MNAFQILGLTFLAIVGLQSLIAMAQVAGSRRAALLRLSVVIVAAIAIAEPNSVQRVATAIGIGRGADVVLYSFSLAFLATTFYFYSRYIRLQQQVTELVRHAAISEARRGTAPESVELSDSE